MDARELCEKAGIDPDKEITKFVMEDFAGVLIDGNRPEENAIEILRKARVIDLEDRIRWDCEFSSYADDLLEDGWGIKCTT